MYCIDCGKEMKEEWCDNSRPDTMHHSEMLYSCDCGRVMHESQDNPGEYHVFKENKNGIVNDDTKYAIIDAKKNVVARFSTENHRDVLFGMITNLNGNNFARVTLENDEVQMRTLK